MLLIWGRLTIAAGSRVGCRPGSVHDAGTPPAPGRDRARSVRSRTGACLPAWLLPALANIVFAATLPSGSPFCMRAARHPSAGYHAAIAGHRRLQCGGPATPHSSSLRRRVLNTAERASFWKVALWTPALLAGQCRWRPGARSGNLYRRPHHWEKDPTTRSGRHPAPTMSAGSVLNDRLVLLAITLQVTAVHRELESRMWRMAARPARRRLSKLGGGRPYTFTRRGGGGGRYGCGGTWRHAPANSRPNASVRQNRSARTSRVLRRIVAAVVKALELCFLPQIFEPELEEGGYPSSR